MAFASSHGATLFYCITVEGGFQNETWLWSGSVWAQIIPAEQPGPPPPGNLTGYALAYDSARDVVVLFGGSYSGTHFDDTWEWDGLNWTQVATSGPPAGPGYRMVYDSERAVVVLLRWWGGGNPQFWEWDGVAWVQRNPPVFPPDRQSFPMAYDSRRHVTVVFGGEWGQAALDDTWEWDGTTWAERTPPSSPQGRHGHSMVYDSVRGVTVLFGGSDINPPYFDDTWEWNGSTWSEVSVTTRPPPRWGYVAAFDSLRGKTVIYWPGHGGMTEFR